MSLRIYIITTVIACVLSAVSAFFDYRISLGILLTTCFSMFMASGSMQDDAVKKSIPVVEASSLKEKIERCSALMDGGMSFSQAARDENLYEPSVGRLLVPAERSGKLDVVLKKVISGLKEKNEENVARISNTVEPVLTGVLLIAVGLILISLMIPLVGIMNSIG